VLSLRDYYERGLSTSEKEIFDDKPEYQLGMDDCFRFKSRSRSEYPSPLQAD
jgi:hypothetical protein